MGVDHRVQLLNFQTQLPDFFSQIAAYRLALLDNYTCKHFENGFALGMQALV